MTDDPITFSNDNTPKMLGLEYQKLIALERCLNSKPNDYIWIECRGDVATEDTSIEVKHHNEKHNITSNSKDVWNTIKNYVNENAALEGFNALLLHTTSEVPEDSIFYEWNGKTAAKKCELLLNHTPSATIEEYHSTLKKIPKKDLKQILGMFRIESEKPKIQEKWDELKQHQKLILIPETFRDFAIERLVGYITKLAIDAPKKWQVIINDFNDDFSTIMSRFVSSSTPFPSFKKEDVTISNKNFRFTEKMKDVGLKESTIQDALSDYLRAQLSQVKILSMKPPLKDSLDEYDEDVGRKINDEKQAFSYDIKEAEIGTDTAHKKSIDLYHSCKRAPLIEIPNVRDLRPYYRDGRIHHLVESTDFEWKFNFDDL